MKLLIDECVPRGFKASLAEERYVCVKVPEAGLSGKTNGELLRLAQGKFDVFVTLDKGLEYQQNLTKHRIAILLIRTRSNRLADLLAHVPVCRAALRTIRPGELVRVGETE